ADRAADDGEVPGLDAEGAEIGRRIEVPLGDRRRVHRAGGRGAADRAGEASGAHRADGHSAGSRWTALPKPWLWRMLASMALLHRIAAALMGACIPVTAIGAGCGDKIASFNGLTNEMTNHTPSPTTGGAGGGHTTGTSTTTTGSTGTGTLTGLGLCA